MWALLLTAIALAGPLDDVRERVEGDAWINWTEMEVEVHGVAHPSGVDASRKVVETTARRPLGAKIERAMNQVRVVSDRTVEDLRADPGLAATLEHRMARWSVREARYYQSGRVELFAVLSIRDVLKPWSLPRAEPSPTKEDTHYTGWVVDARGTGVRPLVTPEFVDQGGVLLYDGQAWSDAPPQTVAVIYVPDPAHPSSARAGAHPLMSRVVGVSDGRLVIDAESVTEAKRSLLGERVLGLGRVVIVVDP